MSDRRAPRADAEAIRFTPAWGDIPAKRRGAFWHRRK